jgi:hypothetical protein
MVWVKATNCARCGAALAPEAAAPGVATPMAFTPSPIVPNQPEAAPRPRPFGLGRVRPRLGDRGTAAALGATLALMLVIGGVAAALGNWNGIGQMVGPNCSFGVTGTAASITVRGWSSGAACKALRSGANFQTYDLPREASNQPVICNYPLLNDRIVVHDEAAGTAGGTLCQALHDAFNRPASPAPTTSP